MLTVPRRYRVVLLKYGYHDPVRVCVSCHELCTQSEEMMTAISANGSVPPSIHHLHSFVAFRSNVAPIIDSAEGHDSKVTIMVVVMTTTNVMNAA